MITIKHQDNRSLVTVGDNAGGIPADNIERVFTQYVSTKKNGSGLGLYIAKKMIEESMHGKLWVENHADGAMFFIVL